MSRSVRIATIPTERPFLPATVMATLTVALAAAPLAAQPPQTTVTVPYQSIGEGFYERTGVSWGAGGRGWTLSSGSPGGVLPPFGGYSPGAGIRGGFAGGRPGGGGFHMNFAAEQGNRRTASTQTPSLTVANGLPGWLRAAQWRPFVVGYAPVVGGLPVFPMMPLDNSPGYTPAGAVLERYRQLTAEEDGAGQSGNRVLLGPIDRAAEAARRRWSPDTPGGSPRLSPADTSSPVTADSVARRLAGRSSSSLGTGEPGAAAAESTPPSDAASESARRLAAAAASTAGQPAVSVDRARQLREEETAARQREAEDLYRRAVEAETAGKIGVARAYYQMVTQRAEGELKNQALARYKALGTASKPSR